jgi:hypothetical protein
MDRRTEPPIWPPDESEIPDENEIPEDDGAAPRFFFLAGLALVMVWLTQQVLL